MGRSSKHSENSAERGSSTETAYKVLREMIVHGRLAPGSWIIESDLANLLHMSRTPTRAALQWLQHEGYVVERGTGSKSRVMVAPLTLSDARELYAIVGSIEGIAGRNTAALAPEQRKAVVGALKELHSKMVKIAKSSAPDPVEFADTDTAFHDQVVQSSAGPRLLAIYNGIKPQTDRYWNLYSQLITEDMKTSCAEHSAIVDAIAAGDGKCTERALEVNWSNGAERLAKAIQKFGERGTW
jgi:DNA-binding GntR family transcriptional regulator